MVYFCKQSSAIVLVQETMGPSAELCSLLEKSIKGWSFIGLDATRNSGDFITSCRDNISVLNVLAVTSGLMLEFFSKVLNRNLKVLNAYKRYADKRKYWDKVFNSKLILGPNLIVGGDFNFTLNHGELWGTSIRLNPLFEYFINELEEWISRHQTS